MMEKFRESRRNSHRKQPSFKLQNLSPQKYGRAAYNEMCYTPSKLADNVLYKQATNMKKYEQSSQKLREVEAAYKLLEDKYNKLLKQKQGMQSSLNLQIQMYKKLIDEMEEKAEARLKLAQEAFKNQIDSIVAAKEEQAKFAQSEKEQLQNLIEQLEKIGNQLEDRLNNTTHQLKNTISQLNNKIQQAKNLQQKLEDTILQHKEEIDKLFQTVENLKQKIVATEREWREKRDQAIAEKNNEIKEIQKQFKQEINHMNSEREQERNKLISQSKEITQKFETEVRRLNDHIETKNKNIEEINKQIAENQEKAGNMSKGYEQEIIELSNEKSRLFEEVDKLNQQNTHLNVLLKQLQITANKQKTNLQGFILKLKEDIIYNQNNLLRERDRNVINHNDSSKQIIILKRENAALKQEIDNFSIKEGDNQLLAKQVRKMREMLRDSSYELEKCKEEYIKLGKERDLLAIRLEEANYEICSLRRVKIDREDEAKSWRDSFYLTRSRSRSRR